jgi:hypothetical protein
MTFDEYGKLYAFWYASWTALIKAFSDTLLDVGTAEEPVDTG